MKRSQVREEERKEGKVETIEAHEVAKKGYEKAEAISLVRRILGYKLAQFLF